MLLVIFYQASTLQVLFFLSSSLPTKGGGSCMFQGFKCRGIFVLVSFSVPSVVV